MKESKLIEEKDGRYFVTCFKCGHPIDYGFFLPWKRASHSICK